MALFKGAGVALVTPFKDSDVDFYALEHLIEWQIENEIDAIISCGTTGEASTLSVKEQLSVIDFTVRKVNGRVPVIAGAGSNSTSTAMFLGKEIEEVGADGLLIVTPYYNKCTQGGLINHYEMIADYTSLPIILYSVKSRTGVNIDPKTVLALSKHPQIVGIKEASGDISQICKIATMVNKDFALYSGNDDQTVPILSLGGIGCISTVANIIPKDYHKMIYEYLHGNTKLARKMQLKMCPLIEAVFGEVNPIPIKAALNIMGLIEKEYRMPLSEPTNATLYWLYDEMKKYGIPT
ncbi:MAG: 4-hydroxy-tetrahydrodipicolinate synthase [Anaerovoracaceae bacterium]